MRDGRVTASASRHECQHPLAGRGVTRLLVARLDPRDAQRIDHSLHRGEVGAGGGAEAEDAEPRIAPAQLAEHTRVPVVLRGSVVRLVDHEAADPPPVEHAALQVVRQSLRRAEEEAAAPPERGADGGRVRAAHHPRVPLGAQPHRRAARAELLRDKRAGRRHEDDDVAGKPPPEVVDDDGGDERLAQPGGEADQRVLQQRGACDRMLVRAEVDRRGEEPRAEGGGVGLRRRAGRVVGWRIGGERRRVAGRGRAAAVVERLAKKREPHKARKRDDELMKV
ncbi:hypothetical protein AB1Y20_013160 [Prymnesium parvum]|uniref:Uncharacterized protein n=1 Tax=Prymnesium parvum TaxID=97485 RepID=A0AB34INF6_PRYPA